jgi:hypothetical protein
MSSLCDNPDILQTDLTATSSSVANYLIRHWIIRRLRPCLSAICCFFLVKVQQDFLGSDQGWEQNIRSLDADLDPDSLCDFSKLLKVSHEWKRSPPRKDSAPYLYTGPPAVDFTGLFEVQIICRMCRCLENGEILCRC